MKKIAVLGANGKAGSLIVKEAVERGFDVTAIVRNENKTLAQNVIKKDLFDLSKEDLTHYDAVVSALGFWTLETFPLFTKAFNFISDLISGTNTRFLVVGGAGSLYIDDTLTIQLSQTADFPTEYLPLATAMGDALSELRKRNDVNWTFISPAAEFDPEGVRTGEYILAGEVFTVNEKGESYISYADYAIALVDEIERGTHLKARISVLGK